MESEGPVRGGLGVANFDSPPGPKSSKALQAVEGMVLPVMSVSLPVCPVRSRHGRRVFFAIGGKRIRTMRHFPYRYPYKENVPSFGRFYRRSEGERWDIFLKGVEGPDHGASLPSFPSSQSRGSGILDRSKCPIRWFILAPAS
jgi:hypothetical protein